VKVVDVDHRTINKYMIDIIEGRYKYDFEEDDF